MAVRTHSEHKKPFDQAQRKLKEQAKLFYSQHNVTPVLEKLLNKLFVENPDDVYGYMVSQRKLVKSYNFNRASNIIAERNH